MSPSWRPLVGVLLLALSAPARAGVTRGVDPVSLGETGSIKIGGAPQITMPLNPSVLLAPSLVAPALVGAPAPVLPDPALRLPVQPVQMTAPRGPSASLLTPTPVAQPVRTSVEALRLTGAALDQSAPSSPDSAQNIDALFDGTRAHAAADASVDASAQSGTPRATGLTRATQKTARRMPDGVKRAFQNSGVLGGGTAGIGAALYTWTQTLASAPTLPQYALLALPLLLIPFHFSLVSGFWASRYYAYPRMSPAIKSIFQRAWRAASLLYPLSAAAALAYWFQLVSASPEVLALLGLPALIALGEVVHHFIYRIVPERAQDKGKSLLDWRSRLGGNIGQQLSRMRAK